MSLSAFILANLPGQEKDKIISGEIIHGYRVLTLDENQKAASFTVYRGDYIKFTFAPSADKPILSIPALSVREKLSGILNDAPYFKMKRTGSFEFSLGAATGNINVIDYTQDSYREFASREAAGFIKTARPLILDVRTRHEYQSGHLADAVLMPVQELARRIGELSEHKHSDILIYCATGNRSTVASKILIDKGFNRIYNLRYGIRQWTLDRYPVVQP